MPHIPSLTAAVLMLGLAGPALAQSTAPSTAKPNPVTQPAKPSTAPSASTAALADKVNLNTATADQLDKLPQIGPARSKMIVEARTKGKFKSWDDFVSRKVVPANAETAIKDLVVVN